MTTTSNPPPINVKVYFDKDPLQQSALRYLGLGMKFIMRAGLAASSDSFSHYHQRRDHQTNHGNFIAYDGNVLSQAEIKSRIIEGNGEILYPDCIFLPFVWEAGIHFFKCCVVKRNSSY